MITMPPTTICTHCYGTGWSVPPDTLMRYDAYRGLECKTCGGRGRVTIFRPHNSSCDRLGHLLWARWDPTERMSVRQPHKTDLYTPIRQHVEAVIRLLDRVWRLS